MAAAVEFGNLKSDAGLAKLNEYMASHSYVCGANQTQDDVLTINKLLGPPTTSLPHACRWYKHVSSFTDMQHAAWGKGKMPTGEKKTKAAAEEDFDLFGEDDSNAAAAKALAAKKKEDAAPKAKKVVVNKSSLVIEVKPNSIDTDLEKVWDLVKNIQIEGVTWGLGHKKVPVAFGLYKLQVSCVILDDLVNTEEIIEQIEALGMDPKVAAEQRRKREEEAEEDEEEETTGLVQSAEIASFNKL
eukprot:GHVS01061384.1.p2 GENE.GHVS01061384.1~~GHVS01061384.1.p2  ORF type:complete len:243 (+),score=69.39 GHVS01061384.1:101-829(+)